MSIFKSKSFEVLLIDLKDYLINNSVIDDLKAKIDFSSLGIPLYRGLTYNSKSVALQLIKVKVINDQLIGTVIYDGPMSRFVINQGWKENMIIRPLLQGHHIRKNNILSVEKILGFTIDGYAMCSRQ